MLQGDPPDFSGEVPKPSPLQMRRLFVTSAVPFVAFGLVAEIIPEIVT